MSKPQANLGMNLAGSSTKHKRVDADFYPTPVEATYAVVDFLMDAGLLLRDYTVWEPACGQGHMVEAIKARSGCAVLGSDINPSCGAVLDFVKDPSDALAGRADAIITNPPFNLSEDFIKRAWSYQPQFFAFLLKAQYFHAKSRIPLFRSHPPSYVLPLTWRPNFCPDRGKSPTMDCMWVVWLPHLTHTETTYIPLERPTQ